MAKTKKRANKRSLFRELMAGVEAMREHLLAYKRRRDALRRAAIQRLAVEAHELGICEA